MDITPGDLSDAIVNAIKAGQRAGALGASDHIGPTFSGPGYTSGRDARFYVRLASGQMFVVKIEELDE